MKLSRFVKPAIGPNDMRTLALILILVLLSGCAATNSHNLVPGQDPTVAVEKPNPWPKRILIAVAAILGIGLLVAAGFAGARRRSPTTTSKCSYSAYSSRCKTTYRGF